MSGAGFAPAGLTAGSATNGAAPKTRIDDAAIARAVDPLRHDYVDTFRGEECAFGSMPLVAAKVLAALGNKRGSFAWDQELGDPTLSIDRDDGKIPQRALAYARAQLDSFITAGEVELLSVDVTVLSGAWSRVVRFRDLTTGLEHTSK